MDGLPDACCGGGAVVGHVEGVRVFVRLDPSLKILSKTAFQKSTKPRLTFILEQIFLCV